MIVPLASGTVFSRPATNSGSLLGIAMDIASAKFDSN